jgi:hypothetical protein
MHSHNVRNAIRKENIKKYKKIKEDKRKNIDVI